MEFEVIEERVGAILKTLDQEKYPETYKKLENFFLADLCYKNY